MSGVFTDLLYPSNNDRANRAVQLGSDISAMLYELHQSKAEVEAKIATANKSIADAYGNYPTPGVTVNPVDIADSAIGNWTTYIADLLLPVVSAKAVSGALTAVYTNYLVAEGRIGEAAFAKLVGLPGWMKWGPRVGGVATAAVVFIAVDVVISSITGAIQRDKLRDMLHEQIAPRLQLQQYVLQTRQVKDTLTAVIFAFDSFAGMNPDPSMLDTFAKGIVAKHALNLASITPAIAQTTLDGLDKSRASWTDEDTK